MNYLKSFFVLIISLLLLAASIQTHAQTTATKAEIKQIQEKLDKIKELKKKGKKDDDAAIKKLAKEAIKLADSFYKIPAKNLDGEPAYDPGGVGGEGASGKSGKKVKVGLGTDAFSSPGWLASSKLHEIEGHGGQAASGRWYTGAKGWAINEVEAYDKEIDNADKNGLDSTEKAELKKRRDEWYNKLDSANRVKIDKEKKNGEPYKLSLVPSTGSSKVAFSKNAELFVAGTVLSEERMQVTYRGTKIIEGIVVSAEVNGRKTETRTNANGNALLDFSAISTGIVGSAVAIIKTFDANGKEISSANTTVQQGASRIFNRPVLEKLPENISNGEAVTIPGQNLGADAKLVCGELFQETLSASDKEMTVFTDAKTGTHPAYVITANGVSESQTVNVYNLDFMLPKGSITPKENVQAQVHFESIPVGTKLIFTNKSPETIKMTIPGAQNAANECIYTVKANNGTIPVNITGITRGDFKIALDTDFTNAVKNR